jgi:rare lipoprotein A
MRFAQRLLLWLSVISLSACATFPDSPTPSERRVKTVPAGSSSSTRYIPITSGQRQNAPPGSAPPAIDGPAPSWEKDYAPTADEIPDGIENIPDAVPVAEPRSRGGNSESYEVLGKTYKVLGDTKGFRQRGYASWYGKKFHGRKTANGERYDMFKMTAAHKNLPIPSYVRVTDLDNGKSVVVKINDRGPFHSDRIIDLSYAAAAKLGLIGHGTSMVEITALDPETYEPPAAPEPAPPPIETASVSAIPPSPAGPDGGYLQVGAYIDPINAATLRDSLQNQGFTPVQIRISTKSDTPIHRVLIGPFRDQGDARNTRNRLDSRNLIPQWVKE